MIELEECMATQSWVNREYRRGLIMHPCGAPVLRISGGGDVVSYLHHLGWPVRKSRTQLHRVESRPRVSRLIWC
jgi:hypothetical protein